MISLSKVSQIIVLLNVHYVADARPVKRDSGVPAFDYANDKVRGVNLGGWFVLEPYMTPSLFNHGWSDNAIPVDEYHLTQKLGKDESQKLLDAHWDSWLQESDFAQMASWGLNLVRIPIGYWAFLSRPEDPYVQGQVKYLDRALCWARAHNLKVWIDLHGVPGSQNGFDNSGLRDHYEWQTHQNNINDTLTVVGDISSKYAGSDYYDVIAGIELVNEPLGVKLDMNKLNDFYKEGYDLVRKEGVQGVIVQDAYMNSSYSNSWLNSPDHYNVVVDHHRYQVFSRGELERNIDEHIQTACALGPQFKREDNKWHVVGEWSAALTDCAPLLNGIYIGSRYDGSYDGSSPIGSCSGIGNIAEWTEDHKTNTRRFVEAQMDSYEYGGAGWIYWAYKTESAIEWDLEKLINLGLFPSPVTERNYPGQCNF